MIKTTLAVKIGKEVAQKVRSFCSQHGVKQSFFVEKALQEKLEQEELKEDLLDFKLLRPQEQMAISFEDYSRRRK